MVKQQSQPHSCSSLLTRIEQGTAGVSAGCGSVGNVNIALRFEARFKQKGFSLRSSMINQQVNLCELANEAGMADNKKDNVIVPSIKVKEIDEE